MILIADAHSVSVNPGDQAMPSAFGTTATVTIQSSSDCEKCGKNANVRLTNVTCPDTTYFIHLDSTGHGQRAGIWKGHYNLSFVVFSCSVVFQYNIPIMGDTTLTFTTTESKPPPTGLSINNQSLLATWNPPRVNIDYFYETWSSGSFATNQWTVTGGNNWQISNTIGNPVPSAIFNWAPQCTNCGQYLTSKLIPGIQAPGIKLYYDISLSSVGTTNMNTMAVELWNGTTWIVVHFYDNQWGGIPWETTCDDITGNVLNHDFRIRFHVSSVDTYDINYWAIDNIRVVGEDTAFYSAHCLMGYTVALNNIQAAFVTDTAYHIPPQQVIYGHPYQLCVRAAYTGGPSVAICDSFTAKFLYPPKNLAVNALECAAHLTWEKPDDPVAQSALTGYDIFRGNSYIHTLYGPDSLEYYDMNVNPGQYRYGVRAKYNLGVYGFPGQTNTSLMLWDTAYVTIHCGFPVPFHEGFDQGNFTFHNWTFQPGQGNWGISTFKSPAPCADFSWQPVRNNYSYAMVSDNIDAFNWKCAAIWFDFDYKLADHNATGNEKMNVEAWYNSTWHVLKTLSNNGSAGWTTLHLDLSAVSGQAFKIRFVAYGVNSGDILHWYIDNINVYGICMPPSALTFSMNGMQANLTWTAPACSGSNGPAGYNVYRTGSTGVPPFSLRNPSLVTGTSYSDNTGPQPGGTYEYYVMAVFDDPASSGPLCVSTSDTITVNTVSVPDKQFSGPRVFPNPATGMVNVESDRKIISLQILNFKGQTVAFRKNPDTMNINLDVSGLPSGVYIFRVTDQLMTKTVKVVVSH